MYAHKCTATVACVMREGEREREKLRKRARGNEWERQWVRPNGMKRKCVRRRISQKIQKILKYDVVLYMMCQCVPVSADFVWLPSHTKTGALTVRKMRRNGTEERKIKMKSGNLMAGNASTKWSKNKYISNESREFFEQFALNHKRKAYHINAIRHIYYTTTHSVIHARHMAAQSKWN